ncbi:MAG TPA: hypothetical protein VGL03_05995 [Thermoanaerobaculia bacterium]|jgi:hypothetical protein
MKRLLLAVTIAGLTLTPALFAASPDKVYDIAAVLSGTFEGSTPGNHLTLDLRPVSIDPAHPHDLFLQVTGKFENDNIRQQGVVRLEQQGQDIYFTYIPHFNPAVTALSNDAGRFTESELSSACSFVLKPRGDGFFGDTLGSATCARAMRGAIGKWTVELEPGNLRVRNTDSGETLRFRQVGKAEKK